MPDHDDELGFSVSERSSLRRKRERGSYDRALIDSILDEALICHVGFTHDGSTFVTPTAYARVGDSLYMHGAQANRTLKAITSGIESCVTVTLFDGLVLARSAFHHSVNYRSVTLFGRAIRINEQEEKLAGVLAILEHLVPGRSKDARAPTPSEMLATLVARFPIGEGSAKVRTGGPIDDDEDLDLRVWAGEIPFATVARSPVADTAMPDGVEVPDYVTDYLLRDVGIGRGERGGSCST